MKITSILISFVTFLVITISCEKSLVTNNDVCIEEYNISYRPSSSSNVDTSCLLNISYYPNRDNLPVILWFHGGGLTSGTRELPGELLDKGFIIVSIGYRLCPNVKVYDCIDDAAAAVSWVYKNIKQWGGNPNKLYLVGHSAGAYLALMVGLDDRWLNKYIQTDLSPNLTIVAYSGQTISHFQYRKELGYNDPIKYLLADEFAPLNHIDNSMPPMLIICGDREKELYGRYEENALFVKMSLLNGNENVVFYELKGYNHNEMVVPAHTIFLDYIKLKTNLNSHLINEISFNFIRFINNSF
jgi:acetyl esterase/lipase